MSVPASNRFTRAQPCVICGGWEGALRGRGIRCFGFLSTDGEFAHCTREEHAGALSQHPVSLTYAHRLKGVCRCGGVIHGMAPPTPIARTSPHTSRSRRKPEPLGTLVCCYIYRGADGQPLHRTLRYREPKSFREQRYDGGRWRWGLKDVQTVLYRLPELLASNRDAPVFLCEGEKDADRLAAAGLIATTHPMGGLHWKPHYGQWLRDRVVVLVEDNDQVGRQRTAHLAAALVDVAAQIVSLRVPCLWNGSDISDWLDSGGDIRYLHERVMTEILASSRKIRRLEAAMQ